MVNLYKQGEYRGLSTDTKPLANNGDTFIEIDTQKLWYFNVEGGWVDSTAEVPSAVAITTPPTKTSYVEPQEFDPTGMVVTATLEDDSEEVTDLTYDKKLTVGQTELAIKAVYKGLAYHLTQAITVAAKALSSIAITTPPTKTEYEEDEAFDPTGMVVKATYNDGDVKEVTGYTYSPLTVDSEHLTITISFKDGEVTKTATQAVTIKEEDAE